MTNTITIRLYDDFRWWKTCPRCGFRQKTSISPGTNVHCQNNECVSLQSYELIPGETLEPRPVETTTITIDQ